MQVHLNYGSDFDNIAYENNGNTIRFQIMSNYKEIFTKGNKLYITHNASPKAICYTIREVDSNVAEKTREGNVYLHRLICDAASY